jgi:hypothetical protein
VAPARERTLTRRDLNRALLARQLLLKRARLSLPRALERVGGLQAQYAPSMYFGLWSRLEGFERERLTKALERRSVVQGTLMRATIHLVSARDYWPFAVAIRRSQREWWLRVHRHHPGGRAMAAAAQKLRRHLAEGPQKGREIEELLGRDRAIGVGIWLNLVRVPPSGTWSKRRADLYAAAEDWLGPEGVSPEEGLIHLIRRYLSAFGPAPRVDIADWAAIPASEIASALERLKLRRFRSEDGKVLVDLPRAPLPDADTPAPVRFLPTWDATLLVHARRTGILREEHRPLVFNTKTPHSVSTFLVDGTVAGTWRERAGRVTLEPFEPLPRTARRELEDEAARLERFLA